MGGDRCGFVTGGGRRGAAPMVRWHGRRERQRSAGARRKKAGWPHRPRGLMGQLAAWAGRLNVKEKIFRIKNWIFEFTKALENCGRRFRGNFDMRIFPKFF
jgi:hypothetical protein